MKPFLPWGSPYCSSHWIGRSTTGLRPCCFHREGTAVCAFSLSMLVNSFWINKWRKKLKIRAGSDLRHDVWYIYNIDKFHSKVVYVGLAQACPNYVTWGLTLLIHVYRSLAVVIWANQAHIICTSYIHSSANSLVWSENLAVQWQVTSIATG